MKKRQIALIIMMVVIAAFTACGQKNQQENAAQQIDNQDVDASQDVEGDDDIVDYPTNDFEARVGKTTFESYDEIIGLLEGEEAYALVNVKGYDDQVLMVASYTYDDLLGHIATTECTLYTMKPSGICTADGMVYSGGTATPITIDDEGVIYATTHMSVEKSCYGENGTGIPALMVLAYVYTDELDDEGNPKSVDGFVRTKNSLINDDSISVEGDVEIYRQMFTDYDNTQVISFTRVKEAE